MLNEKVFYHQSIQPLKLFLNMLFLASIIIVTSGCTTVVHTPPGHKVIHHVPVKKVVVVQPVKKVVVVQRKR